MKLRLPPDSNKAHYLKIFWDESGPDGEIFQDIYDAIAPELPWSQDRPNGEGFVSGAFVLSGAKFSLLYDLLEEKGLHPFAEVAEDGANFWLPQEWLEEQLFPRLAKLSNVPLIDELVGLMIGVEQDMVNSDYAAELGG